MAHPAPEGWEVTSPVAAVVEFRAVRAYLFKKRRCSFLNFVPVLVSGPACKQRNHAPFFVNDGDGCPVEPYVSGGREGAALLTFHPTSAT